MQDEEEKGNNKLNSDSRSGSVSLAVAFSATTKSDGRNSKKKNSAENLELPR